MNYEKVYTLTRHTIRACANLTRMRITASFSNIVLLLAGVLRGNIDIVSVYISIAGACEGPCGETTKSKRC